MRRGRAAGLQPEFAMLVESPPEGDGWLHEVKFDGYRMAAASSAEQ